MGDGGVFGDQGGGRPHGGLIPGILAALRDPATLLRLVPISVVLLGGLALSIWTHRLLDTHEALLVHTYQVITTTKDILIALDDSETGQRGFLLSASEQDLAPYTRARDRLGRLIGQFRTLVADNPDQLARLTTLQGLIVPKLAALERGIAARRATGLDAALAILRDSHDQDAMDAIRGVIGQITKAEDALVATRNTAVAADERRVGVVAVVMGLLSLLVRAAVEIHLSRRAAAQAVSDAAAGCSGGRAGPG